MWYAKNGIWNKCGICDLLSCRFVSSHDVTSHSALIHEYYSIKCDNPVDLAESIQKWTK